MAQSIKNISARDKKALLKHIILYCTKGESAIESPKTLARVLGLFESYRFVQNMC